MWTDYEREAVPGSAMRILPWPRGMHAVLCLTDHADFDTAERLGALFPPSGGGLNRGGVAFTKSVFPVSDPFPGNAAKNEISLDDKSYRRLIEDCASHGVEIAPHGVSARGRQMTSREASERMGPLREFSPRTWIDHGHAPYTLWAGGRFEDGVGLLDWLEEQGIRNVWSHVEAGENPARNINILKFDRMDGLRGWVAALRRICSLPMLSLPQMAYELRHAVLGSLSRLQQHCLLDLLVSYRGVGARWRKWRQFLGSIANLSELREACVMFAGLPQWRRRFSPIRTRDGKEPWESPEALWLFDTILINHPARHLAPRMLDRLVEQRGLAILHTYLCGQHSYASDQALTEQNGRPILDPRFDRNMAYAQTLSQSGKLWMTSFRDLENHLRGVFQVMVAQPRANMLVFENRSSRFIEGLTLRFADKCGSVLVDGQPPAGKRMSANGMTVWFDLGPLAKRSVVCGV